MYVPPSKDRIQQYLESLGFAAIDAENDRVWLNSRGVDQHDREIVQLCIYPNAAGFYSIGIDGGYLAGLDLGDNGEDNALLAWLDRYHAGWKGA